MCHREHPYLNCLWDIGVSVSLILSTASPLFKNNLGPYLSETREQGFVGTIASFGIISSI
jgi:hypothetical protein